MALPGGEPLVADVSSISVECADCGRNRWWKPAQLRGYGVTGSTPLTALSSRLTCSSCREEGLPGRNVQIQVAFVTYLAQVQAEAYLAKSREAPSEGSRAIRA